MTGSGSAFFGFLKKTPINQSYHFINDLIRIGKYLKCKLMGSNNKNQLISLMPLNSVSGNIASASLAILPFCLLLKCIVPCVSIEIIFIAFFKVLYF